MVKAAFHDTDSDTDMLARILADTCDTRDFLKLFLWQAERHADILATILARMLARMSVSVSWNAAFRQPRANHCVLPVSRCPRNNRKLPRLVHIFTSTELD